MGDQLPLVDDPWAFVQYFENTLEQPLMYASFTFRESNFIPNLLCVNDTQLDQGIGLAPPTWCSTLLRCAYCS